jgi:hypothetical protein
VAREGTSSDGDRLSFIDSPSGEIITEGGGARDGDRYGLFPLDANRAWYLGFSGWALDLFAWALGLACAGGAGLLVRRHVRQARLRRQWLASLQHPPANGRATVAVAYSAIVAVLVVTGAAFALHGQVTSGHRSTTLPVPALARHGLTTRVQLLTGGQVGYGPMDATPEPEHQVSISEEYLAKPEPDLTLDAYVTRYATDSQAQAAEQEYLSDAARIGTRQQAADGTQVIVTHGLNKRDVSWVSASAVRGRLLVTLSVRNNHQQPATAAEVLRAKPRMVTQAPMIRDVLAANASRIDQASFPWWE